MVALLLSRDRNAYSGGLSAPSKIVAKTPRSIQPDVVRINTIESEERNDPDPGMGIFRLPVSNDMAVIGDLSA